MQVTLWLKPYTLYSAVLAQGLLSRKQLWSHFWSPYNFYPNRMVGRHLTPHVVPADYLLLCVFLSLTGISSVFLSPYITFLVQIRIVE